MNTVVAYSWGPGFGSPTVHCHISTWIYFFTCSALASLLSSCVFTLLLSSLLTMLSLFLSLSLPLSRAVRHLSMPIQSALSKTRTHTFSCNSLRIFHILVKCPDGTMVSVVVSIHFRMDSLSRVITCGQVIIVPVLFTFGPSYFKGILAPTGNICFAFK